MKTVWLILLSLGMAVAQSSSTSGSPGGVSSVAGAGPNLAGTVTTSGNISSQSNVAPTFVSIGAQVGGGSGTTLTAGPPASIVNGNVLLLWVALQNQSTETFTFPSGFTQIGTTLTSTGNHKAIAAIACKIAASESGNYVVTLSNSATSGKAIVMQLSGTSCTPDIIQSATANSASLSIASGTVSNANDLIVALWYQSSSAAQIFTGAPNSYTGQFLGNNTRIASLPSGFPSTPTITAGTTTSDDFVGYAVAFAPNTTSSTTVFDASNSSTSKATVYGTNGQFSSNVTANNFVMTQNSGATCSSIDERSGSFSITNTAGQPIPMITLNSAGNLMLDPCETLNFVTIGSGVRGGPALLLASGTLDLVSADASQDLAGLFSDTNNDLWIGCPTAACTGKTQQRDIRTNVQTGQTGHLEVNAVDVLTWTGSLVTSAQPVSATAYQTATNCASSASPAVCGSAASGAVAVPTGTNPTLTVNTTAVTANSIILLTIDEGLGTKLSVTCNSTLSTLVNPVVTARTAATSFTITIGSTLVTNPACVSYLIIN